MFRPVQNRLRLILAALPTHFVGSYFPERPFNSNLAIKLVNDFRGLYLIPRMKKTAIEVLNTSQRVVQ